MTERYLWRVYVIGPPGRYETIVSETEPIIAPSDGSAIDPLETIKLEALFTDISGQGYININSQLADNQAIKITASNIAGGIDIDPGIGGITIDTTNAISLDAGAASNFTTSNGNLILSAITGLVNIDAGSGINIGNDITTQNILIGTTNSYKNVVIGSTTDNSTTVINAGSEGISIGDNTNSGDISIASINSNKTVYLGK